MENTVESLKFLDEQSVTAAGKRVIHDSDRTFLVGTNGDVQEFRPNDGAQETLVSHTLSGLVDYIKGTSERKQQELIVSIEDEQTVRVFGALDKFGRREELICAKAIVSEFSWGRFMNAEDMNIRLQAQFAQTDDRDVVLQLIGNIKEENSQTSVDDGVTQTVSARTGIASVDNVIVPNPVSLKPYRTFQEIDQPASDFIFRVQSGPTAALFEGDGGQWRNKAIANIKEYLEFAIKETDDRVKVIA
ncbi:hypothetical protein [Furfurilactobacillus siliginis]|uniref:Phage protein n=1 Tax=Furfurilactobacillus siliginis TaxID=348151 RepID=A0A0R2L5J0_9LACO|nr:hypothetical protein [Furfurilactobacillus siliginis]KRN96834.1 hypothetical protein IV55_GL000701 [Furfurilactobacillus siliginis]GEK28499.1 hypothetical protein LSI01_08100 [Furfurilactobacillus siliginis]